MIKYTITIVDLILINVIITRKNVSIGGKNIFIHDWKKIIHFHRVDIYLNTEFGKLQRDNLQLFSAMPNYKQNRFESHTYTNLCKSFNL